MNKFLDTDYDDSFEQDAKDLLLFHKIVASEQTGDQTAVVKLDNGTVLKFYGNEGCGGCENGWYYIDEFLTALPDNAITDVKLEIMPDGGAPDGHFTLYVFCENEKLNLISYSGYDNGWYGTGFRVEAELV